MSTITIFTLWKSVDSVKCKHIRFKKSTFCRVIYNSNIRGKICSDLKKKKRTVIHTNSESSKYKIRLNVDHSGTDACFAPTIQRNGLLRQRVVTAIPVNYITWAPHGDNWLPICLGSGATAARGPPVTDKVLCPGLFARISSWHLRSKVLGGKISKLRINISQERRWKSILYV